VIYVEREVTWMQMEFATRLTLTMFLYLGIAARVICHAMGMKITISVRTIAESLQVLLAVPILIEICIATTSVKVSSA
jgi:hypothetical protein